MKPKLLKLKVVCLNKKQRVPTSVAEAVKLSQKLLQLDATINAVPSAVVSVITYGDATTVAAELDKAKARIEKLVSMETKQILGTKNL